jgi:hypothetical protein
MKPPTRGELQHFFFPFPFLTMLTAKRLTDTDSFARRVVWVLSARQPTTVVVPWSAQEKEGEKKRESSLCA